MFRLSEVPPRQHAQAIAVRSEPLRSLTSAASPGVVNRLLGIHHDLGPSPTLSKLPAHANLIFSGKRLSSRITAPRINRTTFNRNILHYVSKP